MKYRGKPWLWIALSLFMITVNSSVSWAKEQYVSTPFPVKSNCAEGRGNTTAFDSPPITLKYTIRNLRKKPSGRWWGKLNVTAIIPSSNNNIVRRLTGVKVNDGHNGQYHWLCLDDGKPWSLPLVWVQFPDGCEPGAEKKPVLEGETIVSDSFNPKLVLHPPVYNGTDTNGYLPKSWTGPSCDSELVTRGFVRNRNSGHFLSVGGVTDSPGKSITLQFSIPRDFYPEMLRGVPHRCKLSRYKKPGSTKDDVINAHCNLTSSTGKRAQSTYYPISSANLPIHSNDQINVQEEGCTLNKKETNKLTVSCATAPKDHRIHITGTRQNQDHPAYAVVFDVSNPKAISPISNTFYFYPQGLALQDNARLIPNGVSTDEAKNWSPCEELADKDTYQCRIDIVGNKPTLPEKFRLRLTLVSKIEGSTSQEIAPQGIIVPKSQLGIRIPLPRLLADSELPIVHNRGEDWSLTLYDNKDCRGESGDIGAESAPKTKAKQWVHLSKTDDPGLFSVCADLSIAALDVEEGRLIRRVSFTNDSHRRVTLPELPENTWKSGYSVRWEELPDTCNEASGDTSSALVCKDIPYPDENQWPRFVVTNTKQQDVFTARLDISKLSEPVLSDGRYVFYFTGTPHLHPGTNEQQSCAPDAELQRWRCKTTEIMQQLAVKDGQNQTAAIPIPPSALKPGEVRDWTRWLTNPLPLIWGGNGDFLVRFPTPHWETLRVYDQSDCGRRKSASEKQIVLRVHTLQDLKARGLDKLTGRLGGSMRLMGKDSIRQTDCVSLTDNDLRIGSGKLKLAFTLQQESRALQTTDRRTLLIMDVSDFMAQHSEKIDNILREYHPRPERPYTLGLMGNRLYTQVHSETFDAAAFDVDVGRLQFNHHPDDLLTFLAIALEPFRGTRKHRLRVFLSRRWAELSREFEYPLRSIGYLEQVLKALRIKSPIRLYLLAGKKDDCAPLLASLPSLTNRFKCRSLPIAKVSNALKAP
uniref:Uncharacterized protein n=1 Tax=Candidatus Kentrum sp. MB TaxID=2138164 RepID=A0A450XDR0_9GAMM|nr:MAG: hypothetical protein BECKMB1821G_GA0114241_10283 [Candidatus Kentron sp. MB]VFK32011.1 MAG: hypothetical protein BECKMB1821I_GA0114274_10292 [Candidatus Kentron sp. MB]VFK75681.1 MAG: hypothetical protein BECKMB1821H_GA0114242_102846 [Candidatus Kentron sp. MB]